MNQIFYKSPIFHFTLSDNNVQTEEEEWEVSHFRSSSTSSNDNTNFRCTISTSSSDFIKIKRRVRACSNFSNSVRHAYENFTINSIYLKNSLSTKKSQKECFKIPSLPFFSSFCFISCHRSLSLSSLPTKLQQQLKSQQSLTCKRQYHSTMSWIAVMGIESRILRLPHIPFTMQLTSEIQTFPTSVDLMF